MKDFHVKGPTVSDDAMQDPARPCSRLPSCEMGVYDIRGCLFGVLMIRGSYYLGLYKWVPYYGTPQMNSNGQSKRVRVGLRPMQT